MRLAALLLFIFSIWASLLGYSRHRAAVECAKLNANPELIHMYWRCRHYNGTLLQLVDWRGL